MATETEPEKRIRHDNGLHSRKLLVTILSMLLLCLMFAVSGWIPVTVSQFPILVGGLLTVLSAYLGANVSTKFFAAGVEKHRIGADPSKVTPKKE